MCEAKVYLEKNSKRELIMEDVATITPREGGVDLLDLFGERKEVAAALKEIKLLDHVIVLEPLD